MVSVKIQLKRHIEKLIKSINKNCHIINDSFSTGKITYASEGNNYNDKAVFYAFDNSTNDYDTYKLHITCDWDNKFNAINHSLFTIKQ